MPLVRRKGRNVPQGEGGKQLQGDFPGHAVGQRGMYGNKTVPRPVIHHVRRFQSPFVPQKGDNPRGFPRLFHLLGNKLQTLGGLAAPEGTPLGEARAVNIPRNVGLHQRLTRAIGLFHHFFLITRRHQRHGHHIVPQEIQKAHVAEFKPGIQLFLQNVSLLCP